MSTTKPRTMKKKVSVNMVNTRSNKEQMTEEKLTTIGKTEVESDRGERCRGATTKGSLEINYEKAAADAINQMKQELATKEIERGLKQEIERHQRN